MKHHIATFITLLLAAHVSAAPQLVVAPQIVEKRADTPQSFQMSLITAQSYNFLSSIVGTLGYARTRTLLLTAAPYLLAFILSLVASFHVAHVPQRAWHIACTMIALVGNMLALQPLRVLDKSDAAPAVEPSAQRLWPLQSFFRCRRGALLHGVNVSGFRKAEVQHRGERNVCGLFAYRCGCADSEVPPIVGE
ncbi:hypothetical protein M9X92_011177 [Pyricularia oryzae]|nr:hypothetical protein M9X92_011177 [Pyricularia oryzae]